MFCDCDRILSDWIRDVAAGIAILLEAGGLVTTANPPENPETAPIEDLRLGSRLYLAIRYVLLLDMTLGKKHTDELEQTGWSIGNRNRPRNPGTYSP